MDSIILLSKKVCLEKILDRDFLVVKWLRLHLPMLGVGRAKIPHACGQKKQNIKQKQYCNKINKSFKNGPR